MKAIVLGLGNPLLADDGVGPWIARAVSSRLGPQATVEVDEAPGGGLRLMERLAGYDVAVLVDAICTGEHPAGQILQISPSDLETRHSGSSHDATLQAVLRLADVVGYGMPEIRIVAVEATDVLVFRETCSPAVAAAIPRAATAVLDELVGLHERYLQRQGWPLLPGTALPDALRQAH
jgi:hydrogenase maturation protease